MTWGSPMNNPRTDIEWEELFQHNLPEISLPPAVARRTRAAVRHELSQMTGRRTPSNIVVQDRLSQWLERLSLAIRLTRTQALVASSATLVTVLLVSLVFMSGV